MKYAVCISPAYSFDVVGLIFEGIRRPDSTSCYSGMVAVEDSPVEPKDDKHHRHNGTRKAWNLSKDRYKFFETLKEAQQYSKEIRGVL